MTSDRDPTLQSLFDSARADLAGDAFVADVMARIDAARRKSILGWAFFAFVLAGVAWVVTAPVVEAVGLMSQLLPTSLIELENPDSIAARIIAPLNSVSTVVAIGILVLGLFVRRILGLVAVARKPRL